MLEKIWGAIVEFWKVLGEMSPYLLFGFLVAGVLSVVVRPETVERHLGGHSLWAIVKAAAFGVPLPLCSCGVIPVTASLRKHGASRGAATSFLISTPQTGVDSIFVTLSLLGPVVAIFRPIAALVSGVIGGSVVSLWQGDGASTSKAEEKCQDVCCTGDIGHGKFFRILNYGFVTLPRDIARTLIVGLALAGIISVFVPSDFFAGALGQGITGMLVMMAFGIPVYVCATASVPIAAALIAKGASPGAAIVFLMTGPATNAAAITTIWRIMGRRTAVIYLLTVALCALGAGFLLDLIFQNLEIEPAMAHPWMIPGYIKAAAAVVLLAVLGFALYRPKAKKDKEVTLKEEMESKQMDSTTLKISGMTCSHCTEAVKRAILESTGVQHADVNLATATATIVGKDYDILEISRSVEELGYKVEGKKSAT